MDERARYTLLRRSFSESREGRPLDWNVLRAEPGLFWKEARLTEEYPRSGRLAPPDEEREKMGWLGRPRARECLDPDTDRTWPPPPPPLLYAGPPFPLVELDRFMADWGCGREELVPMPPRVCVATRSVKIVLAVLCKWVQCDR